MILCNKNECTGCSACASICPKKAISLETDEKGFLYPKIDNNKCINCGMCSKMCEKLNNYMSEENHNKCFYESYAVKLKDDKKREKSQSGGLFTALAETILEKNGVVYGASLDEKKYVRHIRISTQDELEQLKGSKYVQSEIGNAFNNIITDLKNDKYVLFSGTPCQVAGIETLLLMKKINKEKFYSCDLICHGVPSPKIYKDFINFLEIKKGSKIKKFNFRDKNINGWHNHVESYCYENDNSTIVSNIYSDLFYSNLTLRKSCEKCKYASNNRAGDITMGDCWGIEKINPNLWNDNKGISIALIQTKHGLELFNLAKDKIDIYLIESKNYTQPNMKKPSFVPYNKNQFWKDYLRLPFEKILKKYTIYGGIKFKIKRKILKKIKRW